MNAAVNTLKEQEALIDVLNERCDTLLDMLTPEEPIEVLDIPGEDA
jgi:hypothetical protein